MFFKHVRTNSVSEGDFTCFSSSSSASHFIRDGPERVVKIGDDVRDVLDTDGDLQQETGESSAHAKESGVP